MAKPKLKPEIKTESLVSAAPRWNVVVLNDPINYQAYVVMAFMSVLLPAPLGPRTATNSPGNTRKLTFSKAMALP